MIKEISNFIEKIPEYYFTEGLEPSEGLHIWIKLDDNGNFVEKKIYMVKTSKKKKEFFELISSKLVPTDFPNDLVLREYYSGTISLNKGLDIPAKKIHSSSPFVIWFKKQNLTEIQSLLEGYFKNTKKYYEEKYYDLINKTESFLQNNLNNLLTEAFDHFKDIKIKDYIKIYFDVDLEIIKKGYKNYLGSKLFNKEDYNINNDEYGLSGFLNGDNVKKLFLMHKTSFYNVNNHISKSEAYKLYLFERLTKNKPKAKLPNPLPIFIDQDELNNRVVELYNRDGVLSFHNIIHKLLEEHQKDLTNYYLILWSIIIKQKKPVLIIHDLDFVSRFRFNLENFLIENLFEIKNSFEGRIKNVFQFETEIVQKIFNNVLIQKTKENSINFRYFDDIEYNPKFMTQTTHLNVLRYRKSFYDYIYKSKTNSITNSIFNKLMLSSILDDIKHDEIKNNFHTLDRNIKEKLNIYFSLNKNFGGEDMASKIPFLREKLKKLLEEQETHIESDEEFAFNAGQLIYYILYQSEAANKTHALLEPYITKNELTLFKLAITRGIDQYKHKLPYGTERFQKLASEVLGYDSKTKIKELLPILLAGYFSNSLLFESKN
jgi:CRISPR-associated protein Csh1